MLDMSKIAYKNANGLLEEVSIKGYVLDEFNQPLTENYVALVDNEGNTVLETVTNGDGAYEFKIAPSDKEYHVNANQEHWMGFCSSNYSFRQPVRIQFPGKS